MTAPKPPRPPLSIASAWDEANAFIRAELGLLVPVTLAFLALPEMIADLMSPGGSVPVAQQGAIALVGLAASIVQLFGSMAIAILALKPGLSVAEALRAAVRRMPAMLGVAGILLFVPLLLLAPAWPYLPLPNKAPPTPSGAILLYLVVVAVGLILAGVRLMLANLVVAAEACGPIAALRRSFELTHGAAWRIFGFVLLFSVFGLVVAVATKAGLGSVVAMIGRVLGERGAARVVSALLLAVVEAGLTAWMLIVLAKIYARLSGWASSGI